MTEVVTERTEEISMYWEKLGCRFAQVDAVFDECMKEAQQLLSKGGLEAYIENARVIGKMGRGAEPLLVQVGFTRFALRRVEAARVRLRSNGAAA